jgi:hypothetical protein
MLCEIMEVGLSCVIALPIVMAMLMICWAFGKVVDRG